MINLNEEDRPKIKEILNHPNIARYGKKTSLKNFAQQRDSRMVTSVIKQPPYWKNFIKRMILPYSFILIFYHSIYSYFFVLISHVVSQNTNINHHFFGIFDYSLSFSSTWFSFSYTTGNDLSVLENFIFLKKYSTF